MLKRALILLVLALTQAGCNLEEGGNGYDPVSLTDESRQRLEGYKREFLTIEDIKLGVMALSPHGAGRSELTSKSAIPMGRSPIVDQSMIMLASMPASLFSMPTKNLVGLSAKWVSGWESMAWL